MIGILISLITIDISYISFIYLYNKLSNKKIDFLNFKIIILIIFSSLITLITGTLNFLNHVKIYLNIFTIFIIMTIIFNERAKTTLIKVIIIYFIELILEVIFSIMFILVPLKNVFEITEIQIIIKNLFTIIISLFMMLIINIKVFKTYIIKILNLITIKNEKNMRFLIYMFICFIIYLIATFTLSTNKITYFTNTVFLSITFVCFIIIVNFQEELIRNEEKQQIILNYMKNYEISLDKYRILKHEILNNLIVLKSIKNKNSKSFITILNKMILDYSQNIDNNLQNISNLPFGIKGVLYYKINYINQENIKFIFTCSNSVKKYLIDDNLHDYDKLCKMLGIFMDNAIEAAKETKDKTLCLDIYMEDDKVIFYIENSFIKNFKLKDIKRKNFSTKGKHRGLGLYIVDKIYNKSKYIDYSQKIVDNKFVTLITLKIK